MNLKHCVYPLLLVLGVLPVFGEGAGDPVIPASSRTAGGFIPKGWFLLGQATGDLNRDGRPDLVLVLASGEEKHRENSLNYDDSLPRRRLVIALGDGVGFRREVVDARAVPTSDKPQEISIRRGVLAIRTDYQGLTGSSAEVDKYERRNGVFGQIGHTSSSFSRGGAYATDTNLITGLVEEHEGFDDDKHLEADKPTQSYRELAVGSRASSPTDLSAPLTDIALPLRTRPDVNAGRSSWRGPADLSASLTAAMVGDGKRARLCVRAAVTDGRGGAADRVELRTAGGKLVPPVSERRQRTPQGFAWEGWYDPAALRLHYHQRKKLGEPTEPERWLFHDKEAEESDSVKATVVVTRPAIGTSLSMSRGARKSAGLLWFTTGTHLPRLGERSQTLYSF